MIAVASSTKYSSGQAVIEVPRNLKQSQQICYFSNSNCMLTRSLSKLSLGYLHRFLLATRFPVLCIGSNIPALATVFTIPARDTGYMFSQAWHRLHKCFPALRHVTCFRKLGTGYMFSRAWYKLHVFAPLAMAERVDWPSVR